MIFSKTPEEHLQHLELVLQKLREYKFYIRLSKCEFGKRALEFLGHHLSGEGIKPSPSKVKVIAEWQRPQNLNELRVFLGFTNYYRKFVPRFSHVAQPLNDLTKKGVEYRWSNKCQEAFLTLQQALMSEPVLVLPHTGENAEFVLSTDSSGFAVGAVLLQDHGKGLQPVEYYARSMNPAERNYPVHEQELLAVVAALKHWRHYLEGCRHFLVVTDHATLKHFKTQATLSRRQTGWLEVISPYMQHMDIFYRRGETNQSDGLSRRPDLKQLIDEVVQWESQAADKQLQALCGITKSIEMLEVLELSNITILGTDPTLIEQITEGYKSDKHFASTPLGYILDEQGLYRMNGRVVIPNDPAIKLRLLQHFHDELGHYGVVRLAAHIKQFYRWHGMT
jgi:hypothetical protein